MQKKPEVTAALEAMGEGALKCCDGERWKTCLKAQASAWNDLEKEYVTEDRRALANMRLFRGKRSVLASFVSRLYRNAATRNPITGAKRRLLVFDGGANYSPNAGKITVPTREAHRVLRRAFKQLDITGRVVVVDEFNTSKMHHICGCELGKNMIKMAIVQPWLDVRPYGAIRGTVRSIEEGRIRFSVKCVAEKKKEVRRDPNAMLNIMEAGLCLIRGQCTSHIVLSAFRAIG
jgi:hypothetical protein